MLKSFSAILLVSARMKEIRLQIFERGCLFVNNKKRCLTADDFVLIQKAQGMGKGVREIRCGLLHTRVLACQAYHLTRAPIPSAHVPQEWTSVTSIQQTQSPFRILILSYFASAKRSCSQMITMRYFVTTIRKPCPALFNNLASTTWHTCNQVRVFFFGLVGLCGTTVKFKLIEKFLKFTKP